MQIDPWILAFSAVTVVATIWMGFWSARKSKTASDFFVAGRSVSVGWNASAISGEYLSAASFMGVAGMVMSSGYDALWYPVCYACGYLFLLLFIAGPLRRFGAYTIPDFAEGRFDSPLFRKIAVVFVLFIGFFYTMPQMKGAGTTLAYIFDKVDLTGTAFEFLASKNAQGQPMAGLPYWVGVVVVGAVITLNVALGGMKGITLVQAFQYWLKMFAISAPIFALMTVYGHYGRQVGANDLKPIPGPPKVETNTFIAIVNPKARLSPDEEARRTSEEFGSRPFRWSASTAASETLGMSNHLRIYGDLKGVSVMMSPALKDRELPPFLLTSRSRPMLVTAFREILATNGIEVVETGDRIHWVLPQDEEPELRTILSEAVGRIRAALPPKAPRDDTWLNPFGPLTTKAAKNAAAAIGKQSVAADVGPAIPLRTDLSATDRTTANLNPTNVTQALAMYADLTGRQLLPRTNSALERLDEMLDHQLSRWQLVNHPSAPDTGLYAHRDGYFTAGEVKTALENFFRTNGVDLVPEGSKYFRTVAAEATMLASNGKDQGLTLAAAEAQKAWLAKHEKPLALLYTYSLIIALVCGTAGLPHILVRFYTNPDGVAAKRTTMWVMILIGVFYLFPPVFGVMGRNLLPELYTATGAKGTDKVVLELPRIMNQETERGVPRRNEGSEGQALTTSSQPSLSSRDNSSSQKAGIPWGSILSGITCAGAFAAFMSTFSGLLVSMTGALAHDVYGRMLNPKSTPHQRLRAFKICAVLIGGIAILLGTFVEPLQINFMVGQAFAIAAASYFPLLFMSAWWRGMTMKGAATGMLTGGICALASVTLTNFSDLGWLKLANFWASNPLLRILCEQPAIWTVPLAIGLMVVVSMLTRREVPSDIRMKMLVLHAPEELGLKQEYIQEHQLGH